MNPYNYHEPVRDISGFYGRKNIVSKIYARIGASRPQSVSIVGDYKIGKTSLFNYLVQPETQKQFLDNPENYIYISLSVQGSQTESLQNFVTALCETLSKKIGTAFSFSSITESYSWLKHIVEALTQKGDKLILFMDDFNLITQSNDFPLDFFSFLRSLANSFNVAYVTSSYQDLQKLCASKDVEESPFFNIFTNMTLRAFTPEVANALISQKGLSNKIDTEAQRDLIIKCAGTFPYTVQLAGNIIINLPEPVQFSEFERKFKEAFHKKSADYFYTLWNTLEDDYKILLELIVSGRKIPEQQQYMLKELIRKDYILENSGRYHLFSPVFKAVVAKDQSINSPSILASFLKKIYNFFRPKKNGPRQ